MNRLFLITLLFTSFSFAEIDIGDDFVAGDLVSAEEFNEKFGKLKKVVGEIKDSDILGFWDCTTYAVTLDPEFADPNYMIENGGNGQTGSGYFFSNSGTLTFTESDTDSSLNSPKMWEASKGDLIEDGGNLSGAYSLLYNKLHIFYQTSDEIRYGAKYDIEILDDVVMTLNLEKSFDSFYPTSNLFCSRD
jgi:hypothetical protein